MTQQAHHYLTSLIVHGVFERFPSTQVLIMEYGVAWLPWLMWRLDAEYDRLREESPWVRRWPSEYVRDHVKLSTQPLEEGQKASDVSQLLQMVEGAEDLLCFSSDYPHGTMDDPGYVARVLPAAWHRKVFCENACRVFGWEAPVAVEVAQAQAR
jgi:predicted TIM-barrel fold metal-dependent hydrolase